MRLKHAYYITCTDVVRDRQNNEITEIHCTYDPASRGGWTDDGRKVKGTLHWVSASHALNAEVRLYDHLFTRENPEDSEEGEDFLAYINPHSLEILRSCKAEPSLAYASKEDHFQFLRQGYFCLDSHDGGNRTASLRDTWARIERSQSRSR